MAPYPPPISDPHQRALELSDEVVQQLAVAKYALSVGDQARAMDAIDDALGVARHNLSRLLDAVRPPGVPTQAGTLIRERPAAPRTVDDTPGP